MPDLRSAIQKRASEVARPVITNAFYDESIDGNVVEVEPYRITTREGDEVEVWRFYQNGGMVTTEGMRVKKDGTTYARSQVLNGVPKPENVLEALELGRKTAATFDLDDEEEHALKFGFVDVGGGRISFRQPSGRSKHIFRRLQSKGLVTGVEQSYYARMGGDNTWGAKITPEGEKVWRKLWGLRG